LISSFYYLLHYAHVVLATVFITWILQQNRLLKLPRVSAYLLF